MPIDDEPLTDTSDMPLLHDAFRRGFGEARAQIGFIEDGDQQRAAHYSDYLTELLWLLDAHHTGEDELLYPLLVERAPQETELWARMEEQHSSLESDLEAANEAAATYAKSGTAVDASALAHACETLLARLEVHLRQEEAEVLPIAARTITPEEWGQLPGHALGSYQGERIWLPFGLATEHFPPPMLDGIISGPTPIGPMWLGGGKAAFAEEMSLIRVESAWANRQQPT